MNIKNLKIYDRIIEEGCKQVAKKVSKSIVKKCKTDQVCVIKAPEYTPVV